jgi:hypothetical protein
MSPDSSCLPLLRDQSGATFERVRYGSDGDYIERQATGPCPDCAVLPGKVHHQNCDQEVCPKCHGQLLMCVMDERCGWDMVTE